MNRRLALGARLAACRSGVAVTEFALLLPILLLMYLATIGVTQTVIAKRKLNLVASTMADLTARVKTVSSTDLSTTFGAAGAIMAPLDIASMKMRISSVIVYPSGTTCVDWSVARDMTALTRGASFTMPASITSVPSTVPRGFILAEANFRFTPVTDRFLPGAINLSEGPTFLVPRQSERVLADSSIQTSSPCT